MKKIIVSAFMQLAVLIMFPLMVSGQDYIADTGNTVIKWKGSKVVSGSHDGTIGIKSGSLTLADGLVKEAEIIIDMNTINNNDLDGAMKERLEGHLKSDDFFSVETFPEASLSVKGSELMEDKSLELRGDLTIKGRTNPVKFTTAIKDEGDAVWFKGVMEIDRSLYDVRFGSGKFFDNLGDKAINDIFTLEFVLKLDKM